MQTVESRGVSPEEWRAVHERRERGLDCCELAKRQHCVCIRSVDCVRHGRRCEGSHD